MAFGHQNLIAPVKNDKNFEAVFDGYNSQLLVFVENQSLPSNPPFCVFTTNTNDRMQVVGVSTLASPLKKEALSIITNNNLIRL